MCNTASHHTMSVTTMSPIRALLWTLILLATLTRNQAQLRFIQNLLRNNLAGPKVNFEVPVLIGLLAVCTVDVRRFLYNFVWLLLGGGRHRLGNDGTNTMKVAYVFDPDAGPKSSIEYQALNGRLGADAIERVGLGEDGREEERRAQQKYRDSIGALTYRVPGLR